MPSFRALLETRYSHWKMNSVPIYYAPHGPVLVFSGGVSLAWRDPVSCSLRAPGYIAIRRVMTNKRDT